MKFTIGTVSSNTEFQETMSLIKSSLLYADEIELIGLAEYAVFNYIPKHIFNVKELDQLLKGISLVLKSFDVEEGTELLAQIDALNKQLDEYAPILKKKKHRNKQEIFAQVELQKAFKQSQGIIVDGFQNVTNTNGFKSIQSLIERKILSVYDYGYDQFQLDELTGGYFGNLVNAMRHHTSYPLFDKVSEEVIRSVVDTRILDIGNTNPEILRHAGVATNVLMTLPTLENATVDEIISFKKENEDTLKLFRKAIYEFSEKINSLPWDDDFQYDCLKLYSMEVAPQVEALNEISSDTSVIKNFGKKVIADTEVRKAAKYMIGGIVATVISRNGLLEAFAVLRDIILSISLLTISPQIAGGFLKTIDFVNKSKEDVRKISRDMKGNTMYYYYKAAKKI